jgi:hypothetical protein
LIKRDLEARLSGILRRKRRTLCHSLFRKWVNIFQKRKRKDFAVQTLGSFYERLVNANAFHAWTSYIEHIKSSKKSEDIRVAILTSVLNQGMFFNQVHQQFDWEMHLKAGLSIV